MQAIQFHRYGGPEELQWAEAPEPHAGPGQIRIAVRAASVNPLDWKVLSGGMAGGAEPDGPGYPGYDASGVVDEVGEGVTGVEVGRRGVRRRHRHPGRVRGARHVGAQARLRRLGGGRGRPTIAGETAERGLRLFGLTAGDTVFVDGGAGGVGAVVVQMAQRSGCG